jgi:hypothetical protein
VELIDVRTLRLQLMAGAGTLRGIRPAANTFDEGAAATNDPLEVTMRSLARTDVPVAIADYWEPGHAPQAIEDSEYVGFSPTDEFQRVDISPGRPRRTAPA